MGGDPRLTGSESITPVVVSRRGLRVVRTRSPVNRPSLMSDRLYTSRAKRALGAAVLVCVLSSSVAWSQIPQLTGMVGWLTRATAVSR